MNSARPDLDPACHLDGPRKAFGECVEALGLRRRRCVCALPGQGSTPTSFDEAESLTGRVPRPRPCVGAGCWAHPCRFRPRHLRWAWACSRVVPELPAEELLLQSRGDSELCPEETSRPRPQRERKDGSRPLCFCFAHVAQCDPSVQRVKSPCLSAGLQSRPESLWLPPWVQKIFCKGQVTRPLPLWFALELDSLVLS